MKILKAYKFRLKPTMEQVAMLKQHGGNSRFVWNKLLDYSNKQKEITNHYPNQSELQKHIIQLKKENDFISLAHSQPIQYNAQKLVRAYEKAFKPENIAERNKRIAIAKTEPDEKERNKKLAKALNFAFPKFKCKSDNNDNLFYPQNFKIKKSRIFFAKLGWFHYIKHREILGCPLSVTISQDGKDYYVSIACELKIKEKPKVDLEKASIVGSDAGLTKFATLSDGIEIKNPRTLDKHLKKLKRESRKLSRQQYDEETKVSSNNRLKQIEKLQKLHRKVRNIRKDFLHKTSCFIITTYDGIILETLDIQEMLFKNGKDRNRNISDVSWYEFGRILEYKCLWNSKYFVKIDQYFPSTQKCSKCGHLAHLSLRDRIYVCSQCGKVMGRDPNASQNIKDEGMRVLRILVSEKSKESKKSKENKVKNTVASYGNQACGSTNEIVGMKQEQIVDNSVGFSYAV